MVFPKTRLRIWQAVDDTRVMLMRVSPVAPHEQNRGKRIAGDRQHHAMTGRYRFI